MEAEGTPDSLTLVFHLIPVSKFLENSLDANSNSRESASNNECESIKPRINHTSREKKAEVEEIHRLTDMFKTLLLSVSGTRFCVDQQPFL